MSHPGAARDDVEQRVVAGGGLQAEYVCRNAVDVAYLHHTAYR